MTVSIGSANSFITFTRASTATRFKSDGLMESVSSNTPRIDYDPVTLLPKGLLIEEQRTNLILQSADLASASWGKNSVTVTANTAVAPDGSMSADTLTATAGFGYVSQSITSVSGTTYCCYAFFKKTTGTTSYFPVFQVNKGGAAAFSGIILNTTSGSVVAISGASYTAPITQGAISIGEYWLAYFTFAAVNTSVPYMIYPAASVDGSTVSGAATGSQIVWGAQFEAGSFPTSYIPTTTASVTRSADVASVPTSAFPYSSTECTLGIKFIPMNTALPAIALSLSDAGTTNRISVNAFGTASVNNAGVVTAASTGSVTTGQSCKIYVALANNDFAASLNGAAVSTDNSVSVPTATTLWIGNLGGGVQMSGYIQNVVYIPRRLTNTELQSRSA